MEDLWTTSEEVFTYVDEDGMEHSEVVKPIPDPSLTSGGMSASSFGVLETYTGTMPRPTKNAEALKAMPFDNDRFGVVVKSNDQYRRLVEKSRDGLQEPAQKDLQRSIYNGYNVADPSLVRNNHLPVTNRSCEAESDRFSQARVSTVANVSSMRSRPVQALKTGVINVTESISRGSNARVSATVQAPQGILSSSGEFEPSIGSGRGASSVVANANRGIVQVSSEKPSALDFESVRTAHTSGPRSSGKLDITPETVYDSTNPRENRHYHQTAAKSGKMSIGDRDAWNARAAPRERALSENVPAPLGELHVGEDHAHPTRVGSSVPRVPMRAMSSQLHVSQQDVITPQTRTTDAPYRSGPVARLIARALREDSGVPRAAQTGIRAFMRASRGILNIGEDVPESEYVRRISGTLDAQGAVPTVSRRLTEEYKAPESGGIGWDIAPPLFGKGARGSRPDIRGAYTPVPSGVSKNAEAGEMTSRSTRVAMTAMKPFATSNGQAPRVVPASASSSRQLRALPS